MGLVSQAVRGSLNIEHGYREVDEAMTAKSLGNRSDRSLQVKASDKAVLHECVFGMPMEPSSVCWQFSRKTSLINGAMVR